MSAGIGLMLRWSRSILLKFVLGAKVTCLLGGGTAGLKRGTLLCFLRTGGLLGGLFVGREGGCMLMVAGIAYLVLSGAGFRLSSRWLRRLGGECDLERWLELLLECRL